MAEKIVFQRWLGILLILLVPVVLIGFLIQIPSETAQASGPAREATDYGNIDAPDSTYAPTAACPGGPTKDGIVLNECYVENFNVGAMRSVSPFGTPKIRLPQPAMWMVSTGCWNTGLIRMHRHSKWRPGVGRLGSNTSPFSTVTPM